MLPRLMLLLLQGMRKEQIYKTINIFKCSVSLHMIGDWNFKSKVERRINSVKPNSLEIGSRNLDQPIFKLKLWKKHLNLQTFQQLCSMATAYLGKMCVHVLELPFLKCNETAAFWFIPIIKKRIPFFKKVMFIVMLVVALISK